jgi:HEPN domain-containing protein
MRDEILNWLKQANADYKKATVLMDNEMFDGVAFYSHQAVENALKSLHLVRFKETEKSHSIVYLAQKVEVPKEIMSGIRDLNPQYIVSRYPDVASGVPAENYDEEIAQRLLSTATKVIEWVTAQMSESENTPDESEEQ